MSRVLSRPMFRRGGSAGSGITSGLSRPGYHRGRVVRPGGYQGINEVEEQLAMIDKLAPYRGTDISDFLIGFGLNMAGGPPSGNIISTAAKAAQGPYKQFIEGSRGEDAARRATATSLLTGQLNREAEERKTGVKMQMIALLDKDNAPKIEKINTIHECLTKPHEIELVKNMAKIDLVIEEAVRNMAPMRIAKFTYNLCNLFNSFYEKSPVIREENKDGKNKK